MTNIEITCLVKVFEYFKACVYLVYSASSCGNYLSNFQISKICLAFETEFTKYRSI